MARHGLLAHKAAILVYEASLTDARSTYLLGELENLHLRVKEIDIVGNTGIPNYSSKSRESQQFIEDPSEVLGQRMWSNVDTYDVDNTPNEPSEHDTFTTIGSSNFQFGL
ncbi:Uncharacterized protein Adt_24095 [Abeliophyllum distichum]|uniref:Uncharacterized protein n=1 Tax=Abeliophyllum distichum TaxID=126358 RepID=A0ABD1SCZ5_9LAMI